MAMEQSLISNRNQIGYLRIDASKGSNDGEHAEWVDGAAVLRRVGGARVAELVRSLREENNLSDAGCSTLYVSCDAVHEKMCLDGRYRFWYVYCEKIVSTNLHIYSFLIFFKDQIHYRFSV
jgi:hypothetical protein